jgi:hypothetical protein
MLYKWSLYQYVPYAIFNNKAITAILILDCTPQCACPKLMSPQQANAKKSAVVTRSGKDFVAHRTKIAKIAATAKLRPGRAWFPILLEEVGVGALVVAVADPVLLADVTVSELFRE